MKKASKKITKILKFTLLLCMVFSQVASPIKTLADEIVPSYNLDIDLTDVEPGNENDEFIVTSNGTKILEDEDYILEIIQSFEYVDGTSNETENKYTYDLVNGNLLTNGLNITDEFTIKHETFTYNGTSYIDVNVYEIKDDTLDLSAYTVSDYQLLLSTENDQVEKIMNTSFEEVIDDNETSLDFEVTGDQNYVVCDNTDGYKCTVTENNVNSVVEIEYTTKNGNLNPNKIYHVVLKVNDVTFTLLTDDLSSYNGDIELDFSKLLPGVYNFEYSVKDEENNEMISNSIEFTYETVGDGEIDRIGIIKDAVDNNNFDMYPFLNYTLLEENEKNSLGNDYRFLDSPLAFVFDNYVASLQADVLTNYNLFDEEGTRYHIITSEYFMGAFDERSNAYRVSDVLEQLTLRIPYTSISIVDAEGNEVEDETTFIQNGMQLIVTIFGEELVYDFVVYGDVDGGYVEISDLSALIDKVLNNDLSYYDKYNFDFNYDEEIDIFDISLLGLDIYSKEYTESDIVPTAEITPVIESDKDELYIGEAFEVLVSFEGFDDDNYINAIEGYVNYDTENLRLDKIECLDEYFVGNSLNNRFIYASDYTFSDTTSFIKLTFTGLTEGTHKVSLTNMNLIADGVKLTTNNSNELNINVKRVLHTDASLKSLTSSVGYFNKTFDSEVLEYTLYVDSSVNSVTLSGEVNDEYATTDGFKTYTLYGDTTRISINVTAEDGTVRTYKVSVVKLYKSSNNNLKSLVIEGYEIDFDKDVLEYEITVDSDVDSLDITALVEDYGAWAKIEGNENFQEGKNIVTITVYAEDGSIKTYKLIVNKEAEKELTVIEDDEEEKSNINTEKIVIIILIILVVIGLLYLIFKKDEDDDIRIEQIKPKKEDKQKQEEVNNNNQNNHKKNKNKK